MLGREAETETEERRDDESTDGPGLLRRALPFGAAFLAGFLVGRRRDGSAELAPAAPDAESITQEAKEAVGADADDSASDGAEEAGGETEQSDREAGAAPDEIPEEIEAVEAPTTRGMPMFGLGTYDMDDHDECVESVRTAIEMGYRHVDTAEGYHNEEAVGDAIAEADVDREELFVATKISPENLDYDQVLTNAEESLERLGLDYVDLLYVHWPTGEYDPTDTLAAFAELRQEGMVEEIGVSNFTVDLLEEAVEVSEEPIFANQVEMHPLLPQTELQQFCAQDDVDVELVAYSPIARREVTDVDELQEIADQHDATPFQVSLAWLREKGATAIPKATSWDHLQENWLSLDVELDEEAIERIDDIDERERLVDPDAGPWNQ
jgi:2,5-diketo-D-gluconate reductase B